MPGKDVLVEFEYGNPIVGSIDLSLMDELNGDRSEFTVGDKVYVKCRPASIVNTDPNNVSIKETTTVYVSAGSYRIISKNSAETIEDDLVVFANSNTETLSYSPSGEVSYSWLGKNLGTPTFSGASVSLKDTVMSGILSCSYDTLFNKIEVVCHEELTMVLTVVTVVEAEAIGNPEVGVFYTRTVYDYITIPFVALSEDSDTLRNVRITIRDFCTDNVVPEAIVTITGPTENAPTTQTFVTNSVGVVNCGYLRRGTYNLVITADGYTVSDEDSLNNDQLVVE